MRRDDVDLYRSIREFHAKTYASLQTAREQIGKCNDLEELTDRVYALREAYKYADDVRKELRNTKELAERIACLIWAKMTDGGPVKTDFCTGVANVKIMASLPKKGTASHEALLKHFGISKEHAETVQFHWPSMVEYLTHLTSEGRPLPAGVDPDRTYPVYTLTVRARKGVDEDTPKNHKS